MKINLTKIDKIIICVSFSVLLVGSLFFGGVIKPDFSEELPILTNGKNIRVALTVQAFDSNGNLKAERCKDDDLVLTNWGEYWSIVFSDTQGLLTNTAGVDSQNIFGRYIEVVGLWEGTSTADGGHIAIGTDDTAPQASDYALGLIKEDYTPLQLWSYANGNVTFSTTITVSDTYDCKEAGFFQEINLVDVMFFHDTFSPISVVSSDTVVITYTVVLSEEFTDNFGRLLESWVAPVDDEEASQTQWFIDDGENNITVTTKSGLSTEPTVWMLDTTVTLPYSGIKIGTGTTSPARDDFNIETEVESIHDVIAGYVGANTTISAHFIVTLDREITEAGFFMEFFDNTSASRGVMMWRETFTAESVTEGNVCAITFTMFP